MAFHATDTVWTAKQKLLSASVLKVQKITLHVIMTNMINIRLML